MSAEIGLSGSPKLSVVIPVYNRSAPLRRALSSLAEQTWKDFEVIVADDGSEEDTQGVVADFRDRLAVQYLRLEHSGSPARPRNAAVAVARGEWVALLDSDDWWLPERLARVLPCLKDGVDLVYHPLRIVRRIEAPDSGETIGRDCGPDPLRTMIVAGNPVPNSAVVIRRSTLLSLGGFEESETIEDFDAWLRLAEQGGRFAFLGEPLGYYWQGGGNISLFSEHQFRLHRNLFERHLGLMPTGLQALAGAHFHYLLGAFCLRLGRREEALGYFSRVSFQAAPGRWLRAWTRRLLASFGGGAVRP